MKNLLFLLVALLPARFVAAQDSLATHPPLEKSATDTHQPATPTAGNLLEAFQRGHFGGHFRTFYMATDNTAALTDYYALAGGGGLRFSTLPLHGFSMGVGGIFNFNLRSSDLSKKDPTTGASNRYEIGLFDVQNPGNRNDLDRMEAFWLRYQWKKSRITLGRQSIQSPFINAQDGRMRPTAEGGVWAEINDLKKTKIEGGWLWQISPRSTVKWYSVGESIGLYPQGLNPDGTASSYYDNLKSRGVGLLGITRQMSKRLKVQAWDQYVENIFNTVLAQADYTHALPNGHYVLGGLQFTHQNALAYGGHEDATKTYFQQGEQSNTISAQLGWQRAGWQVLTGYTRVTRDGRFLSPREWGREPFYTFMSRERIEGSGDVHAFSGRVSWQSANKKLRMEAAYGHFYLPDVKNHLFNKYAFPAYKQLNLDIRYSFEGVLNGLKAQFLYVWKGRLGDVYGNDKLVINRVNMSQYNLVLNYIF